MHEQARVNPYSNVKTPSLCLSREAEPAAGGARAGGDAGAGAAAAVHGAARHAAHRQRRQLGLRALRVRAALSTKQK